MNMLRSVNHQIYGLHLNKTTLSPFDTKRWIKADGIHTLAYGHKDIEWSRTVEATSGSKYTYSLEIKIKIINYKIGGN